jgi:S1-C subfamily serine protease
MYRPSTVPSHAARSYVLRAAAGLVTAVLLAGCGDSGSKPSGAATSPRADASVANTAVAAGTTTAAATDASQSAAVELQTAFEQVVQKASPSVVLITTTEGLGSGIVLDDQGHIVTNAHVVGTATTFQVTLASGDTRSATLVSSFPPDDLAVIDAAGTGFTAATFADSSKLRVGDIVLAMGNPLGLQSSVTQGIVSALGRTIAEPGGAALPGAIQTSAPINPGNSGGALVDLNGQVVGIPTLAARDPSVGGAAPGIGFAIASNTVTDIAGQMVKNGRVVNSHRAFLGVSLASGVTGGPGAVVGAVEKDGPAAKAGIEPGDQILAIDGTETPDASAVAEVLATKNPGDSVTVSIRHQDGTTAQVRVTLGELPSS